MQQEKSKRSQYVHDAGIKEIFERLLLELLDKRPDDPVAHLIAYLENKIST